MPPRHRASASGRAAPSRLAAAFVLATALAACGGGGSTSPDSNGNPYGITATGPGVLSVSPLDTLTVYAASPLGMMSPPGHVLPTDHVYISFVNPWSGQQQNNDCRPRAVRAAGSGVVTFTIVTELTGGDTKVDIQMTKTFHYYYDHVLLKPGIGVGTHVKAGDTIATTTGRCPSMDLGVYDLDVVPSGHVNAARYGDGSLHAVSPYKYFAEPIRSFYYAHSRLFEGRPVNPDGRTDWGVRGTLAGDWFHSSLANASANEIGGPAGWPKTLSFAYDWFDNAPRISIGGTISTPMVMSIASGDPDPALVRVSSGLVAFHGARTNGLSGGGWVLAQLLSDTRLRVEVFADGPTRPVAFSSAAQEYVR